MVRCTYSCHTGWSQPGKTKRYTDKEGTTMNTGFENVQNIGKENMDFALQSMESVGTGLQAIAAEAADYSKRTMEAGAGALEKLAAAESLDKAVEVQSDFVRSAYESYVGQVTKVGEIVAEMTKGAYAPYESFFGKFGR